MQKTTYSLRILLTCVILTGFRSLEAAVSTSFRWENRPVTLLNGDAWISPTASGTANGTLKVDGSSAGNWTIETPIWNTASVDDGWHTIGLTAPEAGSADVLVLNNASVVIHDGALDADEVWQAGVTHIVRNTVSIPEGKRLVMANGAIVKFCMHTGIINNGTLSALSATLTALEDDSIAGDTNLDRDVTTPSDDTYSIKNTGTLTAINCEMYYATEDSVFNTTIIAAGAFSSCSEITKAEIPSDVTAIESDAFKGCSNLKEVTFDATTTAVDDTAFDDCNAITKVIFPNGLPAAEYTFGDSTPKIYTNANPLPTTWSGYAVYDINDPGSGNKPIPAPEEEGEPGQVLTLTEDGVEWQDIPVDNVLDTASENAVQNKVVTTAITAMERSHGDMQADIANLLEDTSALATANDTLAHALTAAQSAVNSHEADIADLRKSMASSSSEFVALQNTVEALQKTNNALLTANQELTAKLDGLLSVLEKSGNESQVLVKGANGTYAWKDADMLLGAQVLTIRLEEGWNLVAMPGNAIFDESATAILSNVEIYTYDRTRQIYLPSEGLEPLASYWMHAPKACTIHFAVAAQKTK